MEIKPSNADAFKLLDQADGKKDGQITLEGLKKALDTNRSGHISDLEIDTFVTAHQLATDDAKLLKQVVKAKSAVTLIVDEPMSALEFKKLAKRDMTAAQKVLATMPAGEAAKLALSLPPKQRIALTRAVVESPVSGMWSNVRDQLLAHVPSGTLGQWMRTGERKDIKLVVLALDQVSPFTRRHLIRQFLTTPVWTNAKEGAQNRTIYNYFAQVALLQEIAKHARKPELRAEAIQEAGWMRNIAQFLSGTKELDHTGMSLDDRKRREYDAHYPYRNNIGYKDDARAQEYWRRAEILADYFTVPKGLSRDFDMVKGDYTLPYPSKKGSKMAIQELQLAVGDILGGDPDGLVMLAKSGKHSFTHSSLRLAMELIIRPKNAESIANLHHVFSVAAQGLHLPEGYDKMRPDAQAKYDQWQWDAAYTLGNLFGAAAVAATGEDKEVHSAVKTIIRNVIGNIPGLKKIPAAVRDPVVKEAVEAILGGQPPKVKPAEILELMEEAHRVIRSLDKPGSSRLEGAFNDGASIYEYKLYKSN